MTMTNKELAEKLHNMFLIGINDEGVEQYREAVRRLRSLPDPTPEPVKDLRWLVGRHEWAFKDKISHDGGHDSVPWHINDGIYIWDEMALVFVRGIVKGLCDEHGVAWRPKGEGNTNGPWYCFGRGVTYYHPTEFQAIDGLLTEMEGTE